MISSSQYTLKDSFHIEGIGLHQGTKASIRVLPAEADSGFTFKRIDLPNAPEVTLSIQHLGTAQRRTQLEKGEAIVHTTEHVIAGLFGIGVDNALIEISGEEPPAMDGSAIDVANAALKVGLDEQSRGRKVVTISSSHRVEDKKAWLEIAPIDGEGFEVAYHLDYGADELPPMSVGFGWSPETFLEQIAPARTFCLESEAKMLQAAGFGLGANTQNTLVVGQNGVIDNELRFADEYARHKVLDMVGDFALLGARLSGNVRSERSGHSLNHALIRKLANG